MYIFSPIVFVEEIDFLFLTNLLMTEGYKLLSPKIDWFMEIFSSIIFVEDMIFYF